MQKMDVCERVFNVGREVRYLSAAVGTLQVVVDPAYEDLFGRQHHEIIECFALLEQRDELIMLDEVDGCQQTDLDAAAHTTDVRVTTIEQK